MRERYNSNTRPSWQSSKGFSLFELTAFIIITAIIYSVAVNRFSEFPAAAERANFLAITNQIQTGLNLEVMLGIGSGGQLNVRDLDGTNPMALLLRSPSNYRGEFSNNYPDPSERRIWFFDRQTSELVYLVNQAENVFLVQNGIESSTDELRFQVQVLYRDFESRSNVTYAELEQLLEERIGIDTEGSESLVLTQLARARVAGAVLIPSIPFKWEGAELDLEAQTRDS